MIKAIVTKINLEGFYENVGMNNRTVIGPYKRESYIVKLAKQYGRGRNVRVEFYRVADFYGAPYKIEYYHPVY
jgi:hypothetical protein